jgi:hypothetical protein
MKFFCVHLCTGRLTLHPDDLDELVAVAETMSVNRERRCAVEGPYFEGVLRTEFTTYAIGSHTGTLFVAELDVDGSPGRVKVHFLVREAPAYLHDVPREDIRVTWLPDPEPAPHPCPPPLYAN